MKTKFFYAAFISLVFQYAGATIRTVSNYYNTPGQYTDFPAAVTASANGDTIYLHPSTTQYTGVTITKQLTVFGAGWDGRSYQFTNLISSVGAITLSKNGSISSATGTKLSGLRISSIGIGTDTIFNVTIERCYITGSYYETYGGYNQNYRSNWTVRNCFVSATLNVNTTSNFFSNNFIQYCNAQSGNTFTNNIFMGYYYGTPLGTVMNSIFNNNIFYNWNTTAEALINTNQTGNTFSDNITYNWTGAFPGAANGGTNNQVNTNPGFTRPFTAWVSYDSIDNYNWRLTSSSVGHLAGTDTTDIGVYGGAYPAPNLEGVTQLPQIIQMNIVNSSIPVGGNLNVNVTGIKRD